MNPIDIILECAKVPSFSSYEERLHGLIEQLCGTLAIIKVPDNNLIIEVPGEKSLPPVALAAHLDKINHYGNHTDTALPVARTKDEVIGQLDDAVGVGICLSMIAESRKRRFPPLYLLFSEMEESYGFKNHPHLLRNAGAGLYPGIGAERIARHLIHTNLIPALVLTVDTTPLFAGKRGIALYSRHWEFNQLHPSAELIEKTERLERFFMEINPGVKRLNNGNDYVVYGEVFNRLNRGPAPSLALEPAIYPCHTKGERVFCDDIEVATTMITTFLENWLREPICPLSCGLTEGLFPRALLPC